MNLFTGRTIDDVLGIDAGPALFTPRMMTLAVARASAIAKRPGSIRFWALKRPPMVRRCFGSVASRWRPQNTPMPFCLGWRLTV